MGGYKFWLIGILTFISGNVNAQSVKIDTLLSDHISVRAITIDNNVVWYAADKGRFGKIDLEKRTREKRQLFIDTMKIEFRSIAQTATDVFLLKIGNPALLYKVSKATMAERIVYSETHLKVFYDSMQFWNDREGMAIGDPTAGCFSVLTTRDGGDTWQKIPCSGLPSLEEGEAAFAASNTNLVLHGTNVWIVSGGKKARVFHSPDKGETWSVAATPIVQGQSMTGIFTADFYDATHGIIAGGNYEIPQQRMGNKAITSDGGKTWKLTGEDTGFGYASCIQYVPLSKGQELVCVGAMGIFYSSDAGISWRKVSDDKDLYTIRFVNPTTAIGAGKNKIVRLVFNP